MWWKDVYHFASSMMFGLVLLGLIGIMAAVGSVVLPDYFYNTGLFRLLLVLLLVNLLLCTGRQLAAKPGRWARPLSSRPGCRSIGIILIHIGIIVVLIGGAVNAYGSKEAEITLAEGETIDISRLVPTKEPLGLRLDEFVIEYYPDGSPSQFKSLVTTKMPNSGENQFIISVNHPMNISGIKAYQQSYGYLIKMRCNLDSDIPAQLVLGPGTALYVHDCNRLVRINEYIPHFDRVSVSIYENDTLVSSAMASLNQGIEVARGKYMTFTGVMPFTVLKLKVDPGLPIAGAGGLMLMTGVCFSLLYKPVKESPLEQKPVSQASHPD